ncbi:MAG: beta-glucosidase BglX [Bacteroidota bacterium]|nr:beta-glucosidase BglX [Bacteroidota bacterium]
MDILKKGIFLFSFSILFISAGAQHTGNDRIEILLKKMTLKEKIGQLNQAMAGWEVTGPSAKVNCRELIREGKVGAILNTYMVDSVMALQRIAVEESRLKIPLIFGNDVIHGHCTIFPIPLGQAASWDLDAIEQSEQIAAKEASAEGLSWTFSPMVDISRDPRWGRVAEGAGEDTWLGCRIAEARVKGFQGKDLKDPRSIMACAKHFGAYGAPQAGRDYNTVDMSMISLYEWYLPTYKACVDAGAGSIMTSFNEINGTPSTSNRWLLTDLLRKSWGFRGFVVTDFGSISELISHGVAVNEFQAAALAMHAGVDMDMMSRAYENSLEELVKEKKVTLTEIDNAVRNVLLAKMKLGLFDDPYRGISKEREQKEIMAPEYLAFARKMVAECCVLLKNDKGTLPIPVTVKTIAVIGPLGDSKRNMLGNWTSAGDEEKCVTLLEGLKNKAGNNVSIIYEKGCNTNDQDRGGFKAAVDLASKADFVVLALGEDEWMSGEASSRANIDLPGVQNDLAEEVIRTGKPVAVVLFSGRPLAISRLNAIAPAILETWFGGTEAGNGIADILSGDYNPSGKITMTFPRSVGQIPVFYNCKNTGRPFRPAEPDQKYVSRYLDLPNDPLYPFGYGLSYTTFFYSNLKVSVNGNKILVAADVKNTGNRDGIEVVQLYIHQKVGSITRPVKELRGFKRISLHKGETARIEFTLTSDDLAFYHPDLKKYYESGEFEIFVGGSSNASLTQSFLFK